ncbi:MAG: HIT family protein [Alistipes sp.]|nr:HIT family protein [Alistipes sp.]
MATIFSRIVAGEIPCYKVAENDRFFAFLDIAPLAKGHTLVIPKREEDYFYDLEDDELREMVVFAKSIAKKIQATTACRKVATVVLGLEVPHAHIHLVPMNTEKDVDFSKEKLQLTPEEFAEIAESLRL